MKTNATLKAAFIALFSASLIAEECTNINVNILVSNPPQYPAKACGQEGWVKLKILVDPEGHPHQISVIESEPKGVFDSSAVTAVESWRFNPHSEKTRCAEYVLVFELDKSS